MMCPYCDAEMIDLSELCEDDHADVQEWPRLSWCPKCGTVENGNAVVFAPEYLKDGGALGANGT